MEKCKCLACGKEYDEYQKFCSKCGASIPMEQTPVENSEQVDLSVLDNIKALGAADSLQIHQNENTQQAQDESKPSYSVLEQANASKPKKPVDKMTIISLIIGLAGGVMLLINNNFYLYGAILGLVGIVLGVVMHLNKNKKLGKTEKIAPLSIAAIGISVIVLAAGTIMFVSTINNYNMGVSSMQSKDYSQAMEYFAKTSGYKDSNDLYKECINLDIYQQAEEYLSAGRNYEAKKLFQSIAGFSDSSARAKKCSVSYPATGTLYTNPSYLNGTGIIRIVSGANMKQPMYLKVYNSSSDELVATAWVNLNTQTDIYLPLGTYDVKYASGSDWYGETDMFGADGTYREIDETTVLDTAGGGIIWTIGTSGGNTSDSNVPRNDF